MVRCNEFNYNEIYCPYCHGRKLDRSRFPGRTFRHTDVHFRMETYFEDECELNDEGKTIDQIRRMPDSPDKDRLMEQTERNKLFLCRDDEKYNQFWAEFGGTTEENRGRGGEPPFPVYQLPVLDPSRPDAQSGLQAQRTSPNNPRSRDNYFLYDPDGMVEGIVDRFGKATYRRLCPGCHNPLPRGYGKYKTRFISVIGVTNSGKTVYISQLLRQMPHVAHFINMDVSFKMDQVPEFVRDHPVRKDEPLPRSNMQGKFSQPIFCDMEWKNDQGMRYNETVVIYDIAGEDCSNAEDMMRYGYFVTYSDGIILLLDPCQLGLISDDAQPAGTRPADPRTVLNTIHNAFQNRDGRKVLESAAVAVCISKSDKIEDMLPKACRCDISPVNSTFTQQPLKLFNATEYNILQRALFGWMRNGVGAEVDGTLSRGYKHYNYFAFSATGCAVEKRDDLWYPVAEPIPRRIAEPLLWLFYQFGYIGSDVPIRLPKQREMPTFIVEKKIQMSQPGPFEFKKAKPREENVTRPLTDEEKELYWYEDRLLPKYS